MHVDDRYERSVAKHRHQWQMLPDDTARCRCGARCGRLSLADYIDLFYPPGVANAAAVAAGAPAVPEAPRLPSNWRSGK